MVIPSIPIALRASLTSSSLNGWMIASIFFMKSPVSALRFEDIPFFAVLAQVQAFHFLLFAHPHTHNGIAYFQNDQGADNAQAPGDCAPHRLVQNLPCVA